MKKMNIAYIASLMIVILSGCSQSEEEVKQYSAAAYITQGLATSSRVKTYISTYYSDLGKLPTSNKQAGLPMPSKFKDGALKSMRLTDGGVILLTFNKDSGVDNGTIELVPNISNPVMGVVWQCQTSSYKGIEVLVPQCSYIKKKQ